MTHIENPASYKSLPHIYCLGDDRKFIPIGNYDPDWGRGEIDGYQPGKFIDYKGEPIYDDSQYKDKKCMVFYLKHYLFGNYPGLRNVGPKHFHIKYVVSRNTINPHDVYMETPEGDIMIFAKLARWPPIVTTYDNEQITLYEVEPHLSPEEMEQLFKDINFIVKIKERYMQAVSRQYELEGENFLANSRALATEMSVLLLQDTVNSLINKHNTLLDKFINLKLDTQQKLAHGIQMLEGKYNLGLPWESITEEETEKSIASIQSTIRAITAMTKNNSLSDNQKQVICQMVINTCGIDYVRRYVGGVQTYTMDTPAGARTVNMPQSPNLTTLLMQYTQMRDNNEITAQQYNDLVKNVLDKMRYELGTKSSPNSAVEQVKNQILGIQPQQEIPQLGTPEQNPTGQQSTTS